MGLKILKFLVIVMVFSRLTRQQTTPEERCEITGNGTSVCIDCFRSGICELVDGVYTVTENIACPDVPAQAYCDDSLFSSDSYGACSPLPSTFTACGCSSGSQCIADPNNPAVILHCESSTPVSDDACSPPAIDLTTCSCVSCSDACPFLDDPNDACSKYFVCSGTELINVTCVGTLCFDQTQCGCVDNGGSSSDLSTSSKEAVTLTTSPENPTTCPSGCPFVDDPNDNCGSYFVCSDGELIPITCTGTLCFDQAQCGCLDTGGSSSETQESIVTEPITVISTSPSAPITSVTCPADCPLLDDPNDNCGSYFVCSNGELVPLTCTGTLCFDQTQCGCVDAGASSSATTVTKPITVPSTSAPVTSVTCPAGCPLLDDPNDSCGSYFVCSGGELVPLTCTGTLCFDQEQCGCVDTGASSSATTVTKPITVPSTSTPVTSVTCPPGCPFVDDPDDSCGSYFVCSGTELIPITCTGTLCFDQEQCGCVDTGASSSATTVTKPITVPSTSAPVTSVTCPPGCPFLDDPDDSCGSYFICTGTDLIPVSCIGNLCFDQTLCGCVDTGGSSSSESPTGITETTTPQPTTTTLITTIPLTTTPITTIPVTTIPISTIPPTPTSCPPGCPFVDDPYDNCEKFYICSGGTLVASQCPGILCFDQAACQCN